MVDQFCQARKAENTDHRTNYAVKYATARGRLRSLIMFRNILRKRFTLPALLQKPVGEICWVSRREMMREIWRDFFFLIFFGPTK